VTYIFLALDPVSGSPIAKGTTIEEVAAHLQEPATRPIFDGLPTPILRFELHGKKARNGVKVAEIA
jgi:hypothetical protein